MLTLDKVYEAQKVIKDDVRETDLIHSTVLSQQTGCELYLKCENLQRTGSFKVRGAFYKISRLTDEEKNKGVIACSAGNHAQGVALASTKSGIRSIICMPEGASISKVEATKGYGAEVVLVPGVFDDAQKEARRLCQEHGYTFIHPFDDEHIMAGQGTLGLEIFKQLSDADVIVVPIGGGGLISGVAYVAKMLYPKVRVYGVQSSGAPSMLNSIEHGTVETLPAVSTIADGIAIKKPSDSTFEMCSRYVDGVVSVTDDQVCAAILTLIEKQKMIAEGAGAVALAAMLYNKIPDIKGKKVVCVISGGNIDVTILSRVISRGLLMGGRQYTLSLEIPDRPGQLEGVLKIIAECGANVTSVLHERTSEGNAVNGCDLKISIETRNFEHIKQIKNSLSGGGFTVLE